MFTRQLRRSGEVRRFTVVSTEGGSGWDVSVEHGSTVVRRTHYTDWHPVERAMLLIEREVSDLEARGWRNDLVTPRQ
jgi:hypothetical protein